MIAVGKMGIRPDDFDQMTTVQFIYAWLGWAEAEQTKERAAWERERWAVYIQMTLQLDKQDRRPMTDTFPLPWDLPDERAAVTSDQVELTLEERRRRALALTGRI